jgi:hypothetical protein
MKMQPCILLSLLCRIFVRDVSGFVPSEVVTIMTGSDFSSLATNWTD